MPEILSNELVAQRCLEIRHRPSIVGDLDLDHSLLITPDSGEPNVSFLQVSNLVLTRDDVCASRHVLDAAGKRTLHLSFVLNSPQRTTIRKVMVRYVVLEIIESIHCHLEQTVPVVRRHLVTLVHSPDVRRFERFAFGVAGCSLPRPEAQAIREVREKWVGRKVEQHVICLRARRI